MTALKPQYSFRTEPSLKVSFAQLNKSEVHRTNSNRDDLGTGVLT